MGVTSGTLPNLNTTKGRTRRDDWTAIPPEELFYYCPAYKVMVCNACGYAVQPTALPRHLKEIHRMHHKERRVYLSYTSKFKLSPPEEILNPRNEDFPLPYLPLEQGWRCEAPRCDYLCVSTKRMELHWSAAHGCKGYHDRNWKSTPLQTFFRGKMLRYFTIQGERNPQDVHARETVLHWSGRHEAGILLNSPDTVVMRDKYNLDPSDSLMLEHYFHSSYKSFVGNEQTEKIWLEVVPRLAYHNPFLLHGLLACTALHMAHLEPTHRQAAYVIRACFHQESALPQFRYAIDHPTEGNCDAIMAFAYLLVVYSFATDLDNSSNPLLIINDTGTGPRDGHLLLPQWLHLIRAGCLMLDSVWDRIESGPVKALAVAFEISLDLDNVPLPYLNHFLSLIPGDLSWPEQEVLTYRHAATQLARSFAYLEHERVKSNVNTWVILGVWPVGLETDFIALLSERHPGALILLAYYCVILKHMEECWYFGGRPAKLIVSIANMLDRRWHAYIQEAISLVVGV